MIFAATCSTREHPPEQLRDGTTPVDQANAECYVLRTEGRCEQAHCSRHVDWTGSAVGSVRKQQSDAESNTNSDIDVSGAIHVAKQQRLDSTKQPCDRLLASRGRRRDEGDWFCYPVSLDGSVIDKWSCGLRDIRDESRRANTTRGYICRDHRLHRDGVRRVCRRPKPTGLAMARTRERWAGTVQRLDAVGEFRVQSMSSKRWHPVPSARVTRA